MRTTIKKLTPALVLLLLASSCYSPFPKIKGSGNIISEERSFGEFDEIILEGSYEVELIQGAEHSVVIEADDNIIPFLLTPTTDGQLKIYSQNNLKPSSRIKLWITVENLESIAIRGSADLESNDIFTGDYLSLDLSGSGSARLKIDYLEFDSHISGSGKFYIEGATDKQKISISGSGAYFASGLYSREAYSHISGSGNIYITADEYLKATISGSGNIHYYGSPQIESSISGSGNIIKK